MKIITQCLLITPRPQYSWSQHYCMIPTPLDIPEQNIIRIYYATASQSLKSSITYVDVRRSNPKVVTHHPTYTILTPGQTGAFDQDGINVTSIIKTPKKLQLYLYYAGYHRQAYPPYSLQCGRAILNSEGKLIQRSHNPLISNLSEHGITSAPCVLRHNGLYKMWYVSGHGWYRHNHGAYCGKIMPHYGIRYAQSSDGTNWHIGKLCISAQNVDKFGFGRPWVVLHQGLFHMWYSIRYHSAPYRIGYAVSPNGLHWERKDNDVLFWDSGENWDNIAQCYLSTINIDGTWYAFYNGNQNGRQGFGLAIIEGLS